VKGGFREKDQAERQRICGGKKETTGLNNKGHALRNKVSWLFRVPFLNTEEGGRRVRKGGGRGRDLKGNGLWKGGENLGKAVYKVYKIDQTNG